jgi:hypothetical protein
MGKAETFNNIKSNPFSPDRAISNLHRVSPLFSPKSYSMG